MEENTTNKQPLNLNEDQLQAITGGTGGRIQNFGGIPKTYDEHMLIKQHKWEAEQATSDAENFLEAGNSKKAARAYKDAKIHYDMIVHINNNMKPGKPR